MSGSSQDSKAFFFTKGIGMVHSRICAHMTLLLACGMAAELGAASPAGVKAIPGNGIVTIVWQRSDTLHSTSYNVYRSTTSGNTGSIPLAANFTQSPVPPINGRAVADNLNYLGAYGDDQVTNGTTYYYRNRSQHICQYSLSRDLSAPGSIHAGLAFCPTDVLVYLHASDPYLSRKMCHCC